MLDYRLDTFLTLSKLLNYTKTAKVLHITQPAVTQHIQYLQELYNTKLFTYKNKKLSLTEEGFILYEFTIAMKASSDKVKDKLLRIEKNNLFLKFGTTLTIGEYTMNPILKKLLSDYPDIGLSMIVENTENLLARLADGKIDFAILEAHFDKSKYSYMKFKEKTFIGICSPEHSFSKGKIDFDRILKENIILREDGSGTRNIFEKVLYELNFTLESLKHFIEIGNMRMIKDLVRENLGISFLYKESVKEELEKGLLKEININAFDIKREFNFVFLKGSLHEEEYIKCFNYFLANID